MRWETKFWIKAAIVIIIILAAIIYSAVSIAIMLVDKMDWCCSTLYGGG